MDLTAKSTGSEAFWRKACSAVPLDKQKDKVEEVDLDTVPGSSSSKQVRVQLDLIVSDKY